MTRRFSKLLVALVSVAVLAPGAALAHTGTHHIAGFASGFAHPMDGIDHILVMVAVGIWATRTRSGAAFASALVAAALFSVFHAFLHGAQGGSAYVAGIVLATVILNACGAGAGLALRRFDRFFLARNAGPVLVAIGAALYFVV